MFDAITSLVARRARWVLVTTALFAAVAGVLGTPVAGVMKSGADNFDDPASENVAARSTLERAGGASPSPDLIAVVRPGAPVRSRAGMAVVDRVSRDIAGEPGVARVVSARSVPGRELVSRDGRSTYLAAFFSGTSNDAKDEVAERLEERLGDRRGLTLGGPRIANQQVADQVQLDLRHAESLAFPILFLLSLWVFRGLVAAALPPLLGGLAIVGTMLGLRAASQFTELSIFALNLVTGLGLGLAIDYSLFIVSRYREELARVGPGREALRATLATAGRTVAFSSLTVIAALASLLVFPQRFLYSMGIGGMIVAFVAAALALVALPAALALLGPRINALAPSRWQRAAEETHGERAGVWYRLSRSVMRRPAIVAVAASAVLIVAGLPFLRVSFVGFDAGVLPRDASAHRVSKVLEREFPHSNTSPISIAVAAPRAAAKEMDAYATQLRRLPGGAAAVARPRPVGKATWQVDVISRGRSLADESKRLVREIRAIPTPLHAQVGGETARFADQQSSLASRLPLAGGLLALTTVLILFAMTGSVVLPVKALVMNLLTLSAAFGTLVFVFQDGRLEDTLSFASLGGLDSTQPILLFVLAFALSTDYGVFLLTRIKEARDQGAGERESVAIGLERTGRIVTAAALLFCVAIGAFATSKIIFIKELGVGTALAVMIDATIVRALLVPALMAMLGRWNWWAPGPLTRIYERIGIDERGPTDDRLRPEAA
jgi:uncharacterized membrane protein YdfJ with MMPL/SSD domain